MELNEKARANKKAVVLVCRSKRDAKLLKNTIQTMINNGPDGVWYNFHVFENKFSRELKQDIYNLVYGLDRHDILFRETEPDVIRQIINDKNNLKPLMEKCAKEFEYKEI